MANYKYLDLAGLTLYDGKIKAWIDDKITEVNTSIQDLGTIKSNAEKGLTAYNAWASFLAGTPSNTITPTLGELAKSADVYTKGEVDIAVADAKKAGDDAAAALETYKTSNDAAVAKKANADDVYTRGEVDDQVSAINAAIKGGTKFIGVVNDQEELTAKNPDSGDIFVAAATFGNFKKDIEYIYDGTNWYELGDSSANAQAIADLTSGKADKATTLKGYGITDAYTKSEVDDAIEDVKVTASTVKNGTYVKVDASNDATGRAITLSVDETALSDKFTAIEEGKTSMSVVNDGVVFAQKDITVSPITTDEINALFADAQA